MNLEAEEEVLIDVNELAIKEIHTTTIKFLV